MKIKSIEISNYRKIRNAKLNMEDNITVLAGTNNSGKTSLVELFDSIFAKPKGKLCLNKTDLPVELCEEWGKGLSLFLEMLFHVQRKKMLKLISEKKYLEIPLLLFHQSCLRSR